MTSISTRRLLLRPARKGDQEQLHLVLSNPIAMKYWDSLPHASANDTASFIDSMVATPKSQGEDFIVEFNGRVIGKAGFWSFPEIGFIFHPDYWSMGLATEAVSALVDYGFNQHKLSAILADVDPRNCRSIRLLEKLGFRETHRKAATIKIGGDWFDSVYFVLRKSAG